MIISSVDQCGFYSQIGEEDKEESWEGARKERGRNESVVKCIIIGEVKEKVQKKSV